MRLVGTEGSYGEDLGLSKDWALRGPVTLPDPTHRRPARFHYRRGGYASPPSSRSFVAAHPWQTGEPAHTRAYFACRRSRQRIACLDPSTVRVCCYGSGAGVKHRPLRRPLRALAIIVVPDHDGCDRLRKPSDDGKFYSHRWELRRPHWSNTGIGIVPHLEWPCRILAKAEFMQPGDGVKDRAARAIIEAARADGRLKPGAPVAEMTSGNMGAGLAVVCAAFGHPLNCHHVSGK